jgi:hypothetical protein
MNSVFSATRAVFLDFHTTRVVTSVLFSGVITLFAITTGQSNDGANIFLFRSHNSHRSQRTDWRSFLGNNLGDHTGANRQTTFANSKL